MNPNSVCGGRALPGEGNNVIKGNRSLWEQGGSLSLVYDEDLAGTGGMVAIESCARSIAHGTVGIAVDPIAVATAPGKTAFERIFLGP